MRILLVPALVLSGVLLGQVDRPKTYFEESSRWFKTHHSPLANASSEDNKMFDQQIADISAEWVVHWPNEPEAWLQRLKTLGRLKATPDHDLEEFGETVLNVANEHPSTAVRFLP